MTGDPTPAELAKLLGTSRDAEARKTIRQIMRRKRLEAEAFAQEADATFRAAIDAAKRDRARADVEHAARQAEAWSYAKLLETHPEPQASPAPGSAPCRSSTIAIGLN